MRVTSRRVATKRLHKKRVLGYRSMSLWTGTIVWQTMPAWYRGYDLGYSYH